MTSTPPTSAGPVRPLWVALVVATAAALVVASFAVWHASAVPAPARQAAVTTVTTPVSEVPAVPVAARVGAVTVGPAERVLRRWDVRRARAWAHSDPTALRRLYAPGSRAGSADVAMLRRWQRRGVRVAGLRLQVLALHVVRRSSRRLVLRVSDREVGATARVPTGSVVLPRDEPSQHLIVLRRGPGLPWRVSSVT